MKDVGHGFKGNKVLAVGAVQRKGDIVLEIEDEISETYADAVRIEQVLYNLIENAVKYSPPGARTGL
jgi:signal transduction histidine kinase